MKKIIVNATTGERTEQDFSPKEIQEVEKRQAEAKAERLAQEQAEAERQAKLESAKHKLTALGLDEAEVNAILGL